MNDEMILTNTEQELILAEEAIEQASFNAFYEIGQRLKYIRDNNLYKGQYKNFPAYCKIRWEQSESYVSRLVQAFEAVNYIKNNYTETDPLPKSQDLGKANGLVLPSRETHVRPLLQLPKPEQQVKVWKRVVDSGERITAKVVQNEVDYELRIGRDEPEKPLPTQAKLPTHIVLPSWQALSEDEKLQALQFNGNSKFNKTNDNVEWARWSWNPVTGCLHACDYCYARDMANRFFTHLELDQRFDPVFYPDRLTAPINTKIPDLSQFDNPIDQLGHKNVFVCSMADLFGKWVPNEWIEAVLDQARNNSQWNFLFLTKFPVRMAEFEYPDNAWLGTTVDYQWSVERAEKAFKKVKQSGYKGIAWLSCEPMMEKLTFSSLDMFDWVAMGGSKKSTQTPEFRPPFEWIVHLYNQARASNCLIYQKTNLIPGMSDEQRIREYPII